MTSHGTNYVLNELLNFSQHGPYEIPFKMISWYSYPVSFENQTDILIELSHLWTHLTLIMSLSLNNDKHLGQYDLYAIPSQIMPCYCYPESLVNQNEILTTVYDFKYFQALPFGLLEFEDDSPIKLYHSHVFQWYLENWKVSIAMWTTRF